MPFVQKIPGSSQQAYKKDKVPNEQFRFLTATTGFSYMDRQGAVNSTMLAGVAGSTVTLPFNYLVGQKQLMVFLLTPAAAGVGNRLPIFNKTDYDAALAAGTVDLAIGANVYSFTELTKNTVFINRSGGVVAGDTFEFFVPHTSVPGQNRSRIVIDDQVDSVALQLLGYNDGFELRSPNGLAFIATITNGGAWLIRPK